MATPNNELLSYGAPLTSSFLSLGPSILSKRIVPPQIKEPKPPELGDFTNSIYNDKELAALARYFYLGRQT